MLFHVEDFTLNLLVAGFVLLPQRSSPIIDEVPQLRVQTRVAISLDQTVYPAEVLEGQEAVALRLNLSEHVEVLDESVQDVLGAEVFERLVNVLIEGRLHRLHTPLPIGRGWRLSWGAGCASSVG